MLDGIKILVAEDNLINQKIANYILVKQKAVVVCVINGYEAIEALQHDTFDIVLMDLQMPGMGGLEASKYVRNELKSTVPIIALTADIYANDTNECFDAGINACISKPFDTTALCEMILLLVKDTRKIEAAEPPVDFSFMYELSGNDSQYIVNLITLFLESFPPKLTMLTEEVARGTNYQHIEEYAHFLKSSSSVVKIRNVYDCLARIEALARSRAPIADIQPLLHVVVTNYAAALPALNEERQKNSVLLQ